MFKVAEDMRHDKGNNIDLPSIINTMAEGSARRKSTRRAKDKTKIYYLFREGSA